MSFHCGPALIFTLLALMCVSGCNGHYRFSDDQYRALGSPEPVNRDK
ncbi:putative membrane protein [Pseudomonas syringae group genomosp. 3]|uniref:Putative membrane protein n=1 Tax=Pseudomonas syringae group genomosp. 3 TaxID=251701 RepID=A0A2K4WEW1_9PSED|nr:putative membrane protein [Pseudomonas syringae group genomosp. 3]